MARVNIDGKKLKRLVLDRVEKGLDLAGHLIVGKIIDSLSTGQPVRRLPSGTLVGLDPSKPGQPPHVLYGDLRQSINHTVEKRKSAVVLRIGSNDQKARRLELGFMGTDKLGRRYRQEPRPYLRPAVVNNRREIIDRIAKA